MSFLSYARKIVACALLLILMTLSGMSQAKGGNAAFVCGKKFRIATHFMAPYITNWETQCQKQRCTFGVDPSRFEGGGITFDFVNKNLTQQLKYQCEQVGKAGPVFEWYIPADKKQLEQSPLNMLCKGDFRDVTEFLPASVNDSQLCPSFQNYMGPSNPSACKSVGDPTCVSPGPDMVAGLVDITVLRADQFVLTMPYHFTSQVVIRAPVAPTPVWDALINIFKCFSPTTWGLVALEVFAATLLLLIFETRTNEAIQDGWACVPDAAYWSVSTVFGGADKRAESLAGRFIFAGHAFFCVLIMATYTGSLGAFLTADQSLPRLDSFWDVMSGGYSTAVVGPMWNSSLDAAPYLGTYMGGDGVDGSSAQFELIQSILATNSSASFQIYTTKNVFTTDASGKVFVKLGTLDSGDGNNPCQTPSASLGVFDMVACGYPSGKYRGSWADSAMVDVAVGVHELNSRQKRLLNCEILLVPQSFQTLGIGLAFPPSKFGSEIADFFSLAIANLTNQGAMQKWLLEYSVRLEDAGCVYAPPNAALAVEEASGVFVICALLCIASTIHGGYERYLYLRHIQDSDETQGLEKEEQCRRIVNDNTPEADGADKDAIVTPEQEMSGALEEMDAQIARIEVLAKLIKERRVQMSDASGVPLAAPPTLLDDGELGTSENMSKRGSKAEDSDFFAPLHKSLKSLVFWGSTKDKE